VAWLVNSFHNDREFFEHSQGYPTITLPVILPNTLPTLSAKSLIHTFIGYFLQSVAKCPNIIG